MNTQALLAQGQIPISILDMIISLGTAIVIGLWVVLVYRTTHRGLTYERSFLLTILMTAPIVGLVMLLIGSNLALSLGLVGALSIIRFRNVIKDSRDMVFLFWSIAVGLGCGTYNWFLILIASGLIGAVLLVLHFVEFGKMRHKELICVLRGAGEPPIDRILELIDKHALTVNVRSIEHDEDAWEVVSEFRIRADRIDIYQNILSELRKIEGVGHASLLYPHLSLPV